MHIACFPFEPFEEGVTARTCRTIMTEMDAARKVGAGQAAFALQWQSCFDAHS
jgi:hypothetical protein